MIKDEMIWLEALNSRNNIAHAYNESIALDIIEKAKIKYIEMFSELIQSLQKEWI